MAADPCSSVSHDGETIPHNSVSLPLLNSTDSIHTTSNAECLLSDTADPSPSATDSLETNRPTAMSPQLWKTDAVRCHSCKEFFTVLNRSRNCRHCGNLFCGACCDNSAPLRVTDRGLLDSLFGIQEDQPMLVCDRCFRIICLQEDPSRIGKHLHNPRFEKLAQRAAHRSTQQKRKTDVEVQSDEQPACIPAPPPSEPRQLKPRSFTEAALRAARPVKTKSPSISPASSIRVLEKTRPQEG
eukprot:GILJ01009701.1.p1 GENE.GILJ01009701.1~~GILJ01009701.1.p1  ORF type:complete len:249 (-),score=5.27 GILJ01009701.1:263-985(-)